MKFTYLAQPPKKYTFEMPKLKLWTEGVCQGKVLNIFAGKTLLDVDEFRNDIDTSMPADICMDVREAVRYLALDKKMFFDTVILDPPYNWRKAKEKYGSHMIGQYPQLKNELLAILNQNAKIISFGYDTVGMGKGRDCEKIEICLVCHGVDHHDTLCLVEEYHGGGLNKFV